MTESKHMHDALIGYSGFVGSTLLKQRPFEALYRSTNIETIRGQSFDLVVCSGAPAQKWIANRDPDADLRNIETLTNCLRTVRCKQFVLISTVDVFGTPVEVDEDTPATDSNTSAYGRHRRMLEAFVEGHFPQHLIVRLAGLVGPGLRKNAIFDIHNANNVHLIDGRSVFQFYPMVNLWYDIQTALKAGLQCVHLTAAPITMAEIAQEGFAQTVASNATTTPVKYDFRSKHAALFGGNAHYQYDKIATILATRTFAQSEPRSVQI